MTMTHFINAACLNLVAYALITRGGLGFARVLELVVNRTRG